MPNHVTNRVEAHPDVLKLLVGLTKDGTEYIDFNKIVPMPEILNSGNCDDSLGTWAEFAIGTNKVIDVLKRGETLVQSKGEDRNTLGFFSEVVSFNNTMKMLQEGPYPKDLGDEEWERFITYMRAIRQTGHYSWYSWRLENWGTKWGAYDCNQISERCWQFNTAWSAPVELFVKFSERQPEHEIRLMWADEDSGNNCGDVTFKGGEIISGGQVADGSPGAWSLYSELKHNGGIPNYYNVLPDGTWQYDESKDY